MRLPPTVQHLLTLRSPGLPPPPDTLKLKAILASTLSDAKKKKAETGWLVATVNKQHIFSFPFISQQQLATLQTCTLLTANSPSSVGHLYRYATRSNPDDAQSRYDVSRAVNTAALMRESAFKSTIFVGVPRVCSSSQDVLDGEGLKSFMT